MRRSQWGTLQSGKSDVWGRYTLTTKERIVYEIDAISGDLLTVTDRNDNTLTFTDDGIFSDTGKQVTFQRDALGRIEKIFDPMGEEIVYDYDAVTGDLIGVSDREDNRTAFEYEEPTRVHYLTGIDDPLGRDAVRNEYDELGRLKRILDVNGEAVELVYDPDNSTQIVKDVFGYETFYEYDERGNIVQEIDPVGLKTVRTYDDDNNLLTETIFTPESEPDGWTTEWTYDGNGNRLTKTDELGNVTRWRYNRWGQMLSETDPLKNITSYHYDDRGNLLSSKDAADNVTKYRYDGSGNLRLLIDAADNETEFRYDAFGNVEVVKDALENEVRFSYNENGDRISETRTVTTPQGIEELVTIWTYDDEGRVLTIKDAEQHTTQYQYDDAGNQILVIDALLRETKSRYNDKGELVETIYPDETPGDDSDNPRTITLYDKGGRRRASIDQLGRVTHYKYDEGGRLEETIYPDETDSLEALVDVVAPGETPATIDWTTVVYPDETPAYLDDNPRSFTEYYKTGQTKASIDPRGYRTESRYDELNRLIEIIYPDETPENLSDNPRTSYGYDKAGRRTTQTDALDQTTTTVFNSLGQVEKTVFEDKSLTTTTYDVLGRRKTFTDQLNNTTEYRYDGLGQLTGVKDALGHWTEYGYDEAGRLIWQEDALDRRTKFEYDKVGRREVVELPLGQRSVTVYDAVGNVESVTDFNRDTIFFGYDPQNRLILKEFPDTTEVRFKYTLTGQMEGIIDGRGETVYRYDERNRLISRKDPTGVYLDSGATIEYDYDEAGNRTLVRTPGGETVFDYDERNRLEMVSDSVQGVTSYFYDDANNLKQTVFDNGVVESRSYDKLNRLKFLENKLGDAVISSYDYTLDLVGNRRAVLEGTGRLVEYDYDALYRLTEEKISDDPQGGDRTIGYGYDWVGNREIKEDSVEGVTGYVYDDNDLLRTETLVKDNVTVYSRVYDYDDNGNTVSRVENGTEETVYGWDFENRLVEVETSGGDEVSYEYDSDGVRVSAAVNGEKTEFLVDKNRAYAQVLEEYVDGEATVRYVHGLDLISQESEGQQSVYLVDGLGSTRVLTDENGAVINTYTYEAFGNLINSTGGTENKYLFAGEQFDEDLDQYYLRQRYYDSKIGRFTRRDTYEGSLLEPVTLHKYLYAGANPINRIDPSGLNFSDFSLQGLSASQKIGITLITTAAIGYAVNKTVTFVEPLPPLGGFGSGPSPSIPGAIIDAIPDGHTSLIERLRDFNRASNLEVPETEVIRLDRDLDGLVSYVFSSNQNSYHAKRLRNNMIAGGEVFNADDRAHHIVPSGHSHAVQAQAFLNSFGIDIDDKENGARLSEHLHNTSGLHRNDAVDEVVFRILKADTKQDVINTLDQLRHEMQTGTFSY